MPVTAPLNADVRARDCVIINHPYIVHEGMRRVPRQLLTAVALVDIYLLINRLTFRNYALSRSIRVFGHRAHRTSRSYFISHFLRVGLIMVGCKLLLCCARCGMIQKYRNLSLFILFYFIFTLTFYDCTNL